jgi:hypothetical protein
MTGLCHRTIDKRPKELCRDIRTQKTSGIPQQKQCVEFLRTRHTRIHSQASSRQQELPSKPPERNGIVKMGVMEDEETRHEVPEEDEKPQANQVETCRSAASREVGAAHVQSSPGGQPPQLLIDSPAQQCAQHGGLIV